MTKELISHNVLLLYWKIPIVFRSFWGKLFVGGKFLVHVGFPRSKRNDDRRQSLYRLCSFRVVFMTTLLFKLGRFFLNFSLKIFKCSKTAYLNMYVLNGPL